MYEKRRIFGVATAALLLLGLAFLVLRGAGTSGPAAPPPGPKGETEVPLPSSPGLSGDDDAAGDAPKEDPATPVVLPETPAAPFAPTVPSVRILVTDPAGTPVPGASVVLERGREDEHTVLPGDTAMGETGKDGTIELAIPAPASHLRLLVVPPKEGELLTAIVDPWTDETTTIRLDQPLLLTGRVVDPDGAPVPGARVFLTAHKTGDDSITYSAVDGSFAFPGLHPGEVELAVSLGIRPTGVVRLVRAGDRDVLLVVDPGGTVIVRIENNALPNHTGVTVVFDEKSGDWQRYWCAPDTEGRLFFPGLVPGRTYTVWAGPFHDRHLFRSGLRPGTETTVPVTVGAELRGRVAWPESRPPHHFQIYIKDRGVWTTTTIDTGGTFVFPSVPPGTWKVRVFAMDDKGKLTGSELIKTGEPGVVHIR